MKPVYLEEAVVVGIDRLGLSPIGAAAGYGSGGHLPVGQCRAVDEAHVATHQSCADAVAHHTGTAHMSALARGDTLDDVVIVVLGAHFLIQKDLLQIFVSKHDGVILHAVVAQDAEVVGKTALGVPLQQDTRLLRLEGDFAHLHVVVEVEGTFAALPVAALVVDSQFHRLCLLPASVDEHG